MNTYWNSKGKFQAEYDDLNAKLVPAVDKCDTLEGEFLRAVGRMYYDYFNNGNCNNTSGANIFLSKFFPNQTEQFKKDLKAHYEVCNNSGYTKVNLEKELENIANTVIEYVLNQKEYTHNTKDMFDYEEDYREEEDWED
jgi:hypothetical protein